jgi:two-component system sensor histidine kinase AlgZ
MSFMGFAPDAPWLASGATGALFATAMVAALVARAAGRAPASATARLAELQSRIRPHFLFNTLNSAIALVRAEPARAEAVLEDLAELFRSALVDRGDAVSLEQEIALAQRYLEIERVRFGDRLRVQWVIDDAANAAMVPPLVLQPLVENAVKHGVEPSTKGADIKISTQKRGSTVVVKVTNTVPAGHGEGGHGVALRNVQERLRLLHDVEGGFRATMLDGIYQVRIEVPA